MNLSIKPIQAISGQGHEILLAQASDIQVCASHLSEEEYQKATLLAKQGIQTLEFYRTSSILLIHLLKNKEKDNRAIEKCRRAGAELLDRLKKLNIRAISVQGLCDFELSLAFTEGMALGSYQFLKYKADPKLDRALQEIHLVANGSQIRDVEHLQIAVEGNFLSRTLVNEPLSFLTAVQLSKEIQKAGSEAGFDVEVFDKAKIQSLKMGGVLAVNLGSFDPPTFSIATWKPENAKNEKPIVLVGKGVVYDTGGLSLKPTAGSMDFMKSDMGGAAIVIGAMYAIAKAKLPLHVIALIPSTDNRPGNKAYVPGDVITMYDGKTVEVLNTDAEGRMLLADALAFAKKYEPELVFDFATLTGSAARAVGPHGMAMMGSADKKVKDQLHESGFRVHERMVEFPLWEEYGEMLKSDIADLKNIGGKSAGAITAGKFLQTFTDYPWIHLDVAGATFLHQPDSYRGKNGTGVGVRMIFDYLSNY